ncbi:hypothetical protein PENTCL1PPCAC_11917 [Pristionchus entomophagus]|uniref:Skp1-related protein n=1 Tax=Pristionchus entomophagus TaxID=358040 RepID=A0AAV5T2D9_9BILA|nr:hypothetical protein PENTCL1PPCAC_11917 [Pristionchus entomophagus]
MTSLVKLISSDNEKFNVAPKIAKMSKTVAVLMEALNMDESQDEDIFAKNPIPLPNVDASILKKVIEWCTEHKDDPVPKEDEEKEKKNEIEIPEWDQKFLKVDQKTLCELMLASNYLDIRGLMDSVAKIFANMIRGKSTEEIRKTFNIVNDFTSEEEEKIRKANTWCDN